MPVDPDLQTSASNQQSASSPPVYPMLLQPEFHERVWGGRRLAEVLGADLPDGNIGESWSMSTDSLVGNGPLEGRALGELATLEPDSMLGSKATAGIDAERRTYLPLL